MIRLGINLHNKARGGQDRSAAEKDYLPAFLRQLNPSAIVCMDDFPLAQGLFSMLPNTIVVYRQYNPAEGHLWKVISPEQYVINQAGITKPGMPLYVMNEPDSKEPLADLRDRIKWQVRVMEILAASGNTCVIENDGPGQPTLDNFSDSARWEVVKPLFDAFKRYPQHYLGLHPYWYSGDLQPDGQSAIHRQIAALLKKRGYDMPLVIFTETGRDALNGSKVNGWRTAGISEEQFAAEIIQARNTLWTEPYIRGACVYCYGSTAERWQAFDIEDAKVLHSALIAANQVSVPAPPPPPPPPVPGPVEPEKPFFQPLDVDFCNRQIAALRAQIEAYEHLKSRLESAAQIAA